MRRYISASLAVLLSLITLGFVDSATPPAANAAVLPRQQARAAETFADAVRVDLRGSSVTGGVPSYTVTGSQPERYSTFRRGPRVEYLLSHLPAAPGDRYDLELSFAEPISSCPGSNVFDVGYAAAEESPTLSAITALNLCSAGNPLGSVRGLSVRIIAVTSPEREVRFSLEAQSGVASLSWIRIGAQGSLDNGSAIQLTPIASRIDPGATHSDHVSIGRLTDFSKLDVHETVLSRFGSRSFVAPAPQRLGWRQGALGTDSTEISELLLLVRRGGTTRAMPFTDRYALFDSVTQADRPTGVVFSATDPALGLTAQLGVTAPFWPQDESATTLPAFYGEITLTNPSGTVITDAEVLLARPVGYDAIDAAQCSECSPRSIGTSELTGVAWSSVVSTGPASRPDPGEHYSTITARAEEGLVVAADESSDVSFRGDVGSGSRADSSWVWAPDALGTQVPFRDAFSFERSTRGHAGFVWQPTSVPATGSVAKHFVMPSYVGGEVFRTAPPPQPSAAASYSFSYASRFSDLTTVASGATAARGDQMVKAAAFDRFLADPSFINLDDATDAGAMRDLVAMSFRSYATNAWMLDRISGGGPAHWFNVWEGATPCCRYNSTIDVAYNDSQLLLALWPGLLDQLLEQWKLYASGSGTTTTVPHDTGSFQVADGQAYFAMPVEEATNYILLSYAHWKATGDTASLAARLSISKALLSQVAVADVDGDSLPDIGTANTLDDANASIHLARNQIYLGVKAAASAQAVLEAMDALGDSDPPTATSADRLRHGVAHTLENAAWRGDHFATNLDPAAALVNDRNSRAISAPNGLMYLLQFGGDLPLSPSLLEKLRRDAASTAAATLGPSGSVHAETSTTNGWASQSIWRDGVANYLGAVPESGPEDFLGLVTAYRDQQISYARTGDGGWWDVYNYDVNSAGARSIKADGRGRHVLGYYPRGTSVFGLLQSAGGVTLDRSNGVLGLLPAPRTNARVPLYALADWSTGTVPVADVSSGSAVISNPTAASGAMAVIARPLSSPSVTSPEVVSQKGDLAETTATIAVGGLATTPTAAISVGHAGLWSYAEGAPSGGSLSSVWDGLSAGQPAYNGAGTACSFDRRPSPTLLRLGGCSPLSVNENIPAPARKWYLAEGSSAWGFATYVLVQNPNPDPATVTLTYMTGAGASVQPPMILPPNSRRTFSLADALPNTDASTLVDSDLPVVAERSMYWRDTAGAFREGHVARGATNPQTEWFLPEGSTAHGFSEFVLLQNPSPTTTALATLEFSIEGGGSASTTVSLPPQTRQTVNVGSVAPNVDLATHITSDSPIVAERAMYWGAGMRGGGTAGAGLVAPSRSWYLAEGSASWGFATYVLLQNPSPSEVAVNVTYNTGSGAVARTGLTMPPNSRKTISLANDVGPVDSSIAIQASGPILAERSVYWSKTGAGGTDPDGWTAGHVAEGAPSAARHWNLAEGTTAYGFVEYVLIQNPGAADASVTLSLQLPGGGAAPISVVAVPAGSRRTVRVNDLMATPGDVSIALDSTAPVVVERSMYTLSTEGGFAAATDGMGTR